MFKRAKKVWALQLNPAAELERHPSQSSGDIEVYAPEEVWALVRAAADERDASVYVTAAFTGLRMGALRWRDVDFPRSVIRVRASYAEGELSVPKSGKVRSVPMVAEVAQQLARLAYHPRGHRRGPSLDGPCRHPDDHALPALSGSRPGRRAAG